MTGPAKDIGSVSDRTYQERREILDALDLPDYLKPLQNTYWERRRDFLRLEEACLRMVESCLDRDRRVPS